MPNPTLSARFHENEIHGYEWPLGASVNLTIDDPGTPQPADYTETHTVVAADWDPNQTFVSFRLWENNFELADGHTVTLSDGTTTRTHIVAVPIITGVNKSANTVEGLSGPFAEIWVDLSGVTRHETADATGHWLADFSVPGDEDWETQTTEFGRYMQGEARFQDEDGDSTATNWGFPYLLLTLRADGSTYNWIEGMGGWPGRSQIYLAVDDPSTPQNPDYTDVQRSERSSGYIGFDYVDFHDHPGFTITVSNGYMAKTITVPIFSVTGYDLTNDTISGISSPFETVTVAHCTNEDCSEWVERTVAADSEGNWLVNFAVSNNPDEVIYDIQPGDSFDPQIHDEDWDETVIRWRVPNGTLSDFDGDGDTDLSVFRPSTGKWYVKDQGNGYFGMEGDIPVAADYDGDGDSDWAVFRSSTGKWYVKDQGNGFFGMPGDIPVPADYDGDGNADWAVFRPSTGKWYVKDQGNGYFGTSGDIPVPADYDGDGDADWAVFRPSTGRWYIKDQAGGYFGMEGDIPVPADYDGDGDADWAVFRPSTGRWYIKDQAGNVFGMEGDIPVPGDYDGDGDADWAVFRPSTGRWYIKDQAGGTFGMNGDFPTPARDTNADGDPWQ